MDKIILSVIVPSYNQGDFIAETLAEPLRYAERGVETLVIDGGSTDRTIEVLESNDAKIAYWVSEKDRGQAHAINKGFERARGRWIAFQNSDDFYRPGSIGKVLEAIERNPEAEIVLGGADFVDLDGKLIASRLPKPILVPCLSQMNFVQNQALFVRSDLLHRAGLLDEKAEFCLDYEWFVRLFKNRPKVALLQFPVGVQRLHEDTKTFKNQNIHDSEFRRYSALHFSAWERGIGRVALPFYRLFRRGYQFVRTGK